MPTTLSVEIKPVAPYDFSLLLAYLRRAPLASLERIDMDSYRRALTLDGHDVLLTLRATEAPNQPQLRLDITGRDIRGETANAASAALRRAFNLDVDPAPYLEHVGSDPVLGEMARRWVAVRPVLLVDPFEALLWAVLGQQINVGFARRLKGVLVELCGRRLSVDGEDWPLFPTPEQVVALSPDELIARQFSRAKAGYVHDLAASVAAGELDMEAIGQLPLDDAIAALIQFRGIGRWTAEYLLMRVYGHPDALPAGDVSLQKIIGEAVTGKRVNEAELRAIAAPWAPWRGWAAFTFWTDNQMAAAARDLPLRF